VRTLDGVVDADRLVAVSQLSELESDLRAREAPAIAVLAPRDRRAPTGGVADLWPWLAVAALGVLLLEWAAWIARASR
jgi:hypothetical protein